MTSLQEVLDRVLRYMVANQENGIFIGTPRTTAEEVAVSSGPMYRALYAMGITMTCYQKTGAEEMLESPEREEIRGEEKAFFGRADHRDFAASRTG
jgi:hypothetical protein